jgi:hypothetical protein
MDLRIVLPAATAVLALVFALALLDQYRSRRRAFQLAWVVGMCSYGIAAGCEAIAGAAGWNEALYRTWYLTGAVWTAGWLGLGTAFLLGRTRFGWAFAASLFLAGLFTFLADRRYHYDGSGSAPVLYFCAAVVLAIVIAIAAYREDDRWPRIAGAAVGGATMLSLALMLVTTIPAPGYSLDPATGVPTAALLPGTLRLLTPLMNVTGALSLVLGAVYSMYVFMPKRRVVAYSLEPGQSRGRLLVNLALAPLAIAANFLASIPGAVRAFAAGQLHSRVPSTILIAVGALVPSVTDSLNRFGSTGLAHLGELLGVGFIFLGFLISIEAFREVRIPFTRVVLRAGRVESGEPSAGPASRT